MTKVGDERRTRVEEDETVRADQVDTAATGLTREQEDKVLGIVRIVELVDQLLTLLDRRAALKTEVAVSVRHRTQIEEAQEGQRRTA